MAITNNLQIKKGDIIKVISGRDKGKIGEIIQILRTTNQVIVKNVNIKKKHVKPKKEGEVGKISQFEAPIDRSNVMLYSTEKQIASRISIQIDQTGKKTRVLKKLL
jgi:large subunit ribosomal protein L24